MQLLVVALFLVLLSLSTLPSLRTINFLLWLFNLQAVKDLNPNSAGSFVGGQGGGGPSHVLAPCQLPTFV